MDVSCPHAVISSSVDMEVFLVLRRTTRPLTGREVARLVRSGSQPTVNARLRRLAELGLLQAEEAGNAYLYTLNREHLAAPALEVLADMRAELERRIRAELAEWEIPPGHVSAFGSLARGDGDTRSDIDLFVVRPADVQDEDPRWRRQLEVLSANVYRWTGNRVAVSEVSAKDVRRLRRERPPIVAELRHEAITLAGPEPAELFGAAA